MFGVRLLPWEYGIRNLFRRPGRSLLTLAALTLVVLLIFVVVGFVRGLESSLALSGDPEVVLVHSTGSSENVENSSVDAGTAGILGSSLQEVRRRVGPGGGTIAYLSPELYLGTDVRTAGAREGAMGVVRGVTASAALVRKRVQIVAGRWPDSGEVLVGRLAATKLGLPPEALVVGASVGLEGRTWRVAGHFAAAGSALESEIWCPLEELQQAMKRQDLSLIALALSPGADPADVVEFCKERFDLGVEATPEPAYYASLRRHYGPVRTLAWGIVVLVAAAGVFAGLNTMYGAVVGRVRELSTLQAIGFLRRAIALALVQEAVLLSAAGSLLAGLLALTVVHGAAVRFTMSAFTLRVDGVTVLAACGTGLLLGLVGALPPAIRAMRMPVAEGLKAV